jgi:hypothetical protein
MTVELIDHAQDQARAQYESIAAMLAAVDCDYDRLEELRDEREELTEAVKDAAHEYHYADEVNLAETTDALNEAREALTQWETDNAEELAELEAQAGDCESEESARERINEGPLSVEVRSDWASPGEPLEAAEFCILLCTGGPAVRIRGELDRGEPVRAWIEYQDWGTPWTQYFGADSGTLCRYSSFFFFGE